eukprot:1190160-Prorocentrum_minimum.AAC.1
MPVFTAGHKTPRWAAGETGSPRPADRTRPSSRLSLVRSMDRTLRSEGPKSPARSAGKSQAAGGCEWCQLSWALTLVAR